jgi:hypothetical protein
MRKFIFTTAAVLIATATFTSASFAASPFFCKIYAQQAVWAEGENLADSCGFGGARWSFDFAGHFAWCLGVTKNMANSERMARKWQLLSC